MLAFLKIANLALAFFLELGVLVALGYWGFYTGQGLLFKIGLGIAAPLLAVVVWALFGAPKAVWGLSGNWHLIVVALFFGSAVMALFFSEQRPFAIAFALLVILNHILIYM
jgi:Protein of unknown function (DUF2568)